MSEPHSVTRLALPLFANIGDDCEVSFEVFPPRDRMNLERLRDTLRTLEPLRPRWMSVTCGAGGSSRASTDETIARISEQTTMPAVAHMTCVGASRANIAAAAERYWLSGIRHIVALRGDAPKWGPSHNVSDGIASAVELVRELLQIAPFEISVAAYPECHPASPNRQADLDNLKAKLDAGATRAITQFFFSPDTFFRFRDDAAAAGIGAEIVPGILAISNVAQTRRFAAACGAAIPAWLDGLFDGLDDRPVERQLVAATIAAELCGQLYRGGVRGFHFYTLNRGDLTAATCRMLGIRRRDDDHAYRRTG
jgi:methylenetetrahydrofolate reductase (NADPH)